MHTKLLTFINIKVLVFAVVAPVVALGGVSGYIIANQKRLAVEQTVEQSVNTTLYVAERELSKHLAAAEILASMVDLKHLDTYTERINEVMHVRRGDWFNVIVMDETNHLYNYDQERRGESLIQTVQPDLTRKVLDTGRYDISPVLISNRYPEPFVVIRVPIVHPGVSKITHVLAIVVRAWTFSLAIKSVYTPEHWRVSVLDQNGAIVGRSAAPSSADPFIGKLTPARTVVPDSGLVLVEPTIDNSSLYVVRTMSKLYPGWSAALGVPRDEVDDAIYGIIYTLTAAGVSTIAIACLLCFVLVRAYARQQTTSALEDSLREKETLLSRGSPPGQKQYAGHRGHPTVRAQPDHRSLCQGAAAGDQRPHLNPGPRPSAPLRAGRPAPDRDRSLPGRVMPGHHDEFLPGPL